MGVREFSKGSKVYEEGQKLNGLYLIMRGAASAAYSGGRSMLHSGDVIGLCEVSYDSAYMEYQAEEDLSVLEFPYSQGRLHTIFEASSDSVKYFKTSFFRQFNTVLGQYKMLKNECIGLYQYLNLTYKEYLSLCEKHNISPGQPANYEELSALHVEDEIPGWIGGYYSTLEQMLSAWDNNATDNDFFSGFLLRASRDIHNIVRNCNEMQVYKEDMCKYLLDESGLDVLELLSSLYARMVRMTGTSDADAEKLRKMIEDILLQMAKRGYEKQEFFVRRKKEIAMHLEVLEKQYAQKVSDKERKEQQLEELNGSLEKILAYAKCEKAVTDSFRKHVEEYKKTNNKNGTEDDIRTLRQRITKEFNQIYEEAFINSLQDVAVPPVLQMFFNFGYVDEELAGMENAAYLYSLVDHLPTAPDRGVYSFYEWLMAIYNGHKEPSRNEFDMDFAAFLQDQKRSGKITQEEINQMLQDNRARVRYELENVFPSVNKVSFGRITTFCPLFAEHNVLKELDKALVSEEKVAEVIENIRKKDFGAYYRETLYSNPEQGVMKEFINVEVLPDVILTPNVGTRGVMWQEIEGKRRTTPARFMMSVFQLEELSLILVRLTAEFRWEMCKRVQGARWNDISERSLTSEYFDYVQFYRKNNDLSTEAKDKIKTDLGRAKNSFKEMFIMDYMLWILYESNGAPRMNKVARLILFTYCPFSKEVRERLKANPMYKEIVERYDVRMGQKRHRMDNLCQKLRSLGKAIPEEIEKEAQFLMM